MLKKQKNKWLVITGIFLISLVAAEYGFARGRHSKAPARQRYGTKQKVFNTKQGHLYTKVLGTTTGLELRAITIAHQMRDCIVWAFRGPNPGIEDATKRDAKNWGLGPASSGDDVAHYKRHGIPIKKKRTCVEAYSDVVDTCIPYMEKVAAALRKDIQLLSNRDSVNGLNRKLKENWEAHATNMWDFYRQDYCPKIGLAPYPPYLWPSR